jgi:hypothetical protein
MIEDSVKNITVAPTLADSTKLIIYRNNGEEIVLTINKQTKTVASTYRLEIEEIDFIKNNYL